MFVFKGLVGPKFMVLGKLFVAALISLACYGPIYLIYILLVQFLLVICV
jgi:hypothetical protein